MCKQNDEINPELSKLFVITLARFHSMQVPVSRKSHEDIVKLCAPKQSNELIEDVRQNKLITFTKFPQLEKTFCKFFCFVNYLCEKLIL